MLKEIIICITILVTIIFANVITQNYTKVSVEELSQKLSVLREKLLQEEINDENAKESAENINNQWTERHDKLAYYIEHNELEKIESEITALKSHIETKDYDLTVEEIDETMFLLKHVQDRYAFDLENIF